MCPMRRIGRWLRANAEPTLALAIAIVFGTLGVLDVLGPDSSIVNAAVLLTLALLAATLLRDRSSVDQALSAIATVRSAAGPELGQAYADARRVTDRWIFKGGTGGSLRASTLPRCVEIARQEGRPLRVQVEVIDLTDDALCEAYARFRSTPAASTAGRRVDAGTRAQGGLRHRPRGLLAPPEVPQLPHRRARALPGRVHLPLGPLGQLRDPHAGGLPQPVVDLRQRPRRTTARWTGSSSRASTRPGGCPSNAPTRCASAETPTTEEVRRLFAALDLDLPSSFSERDVTEIVRKAVADPAATG